ncbi:hypothetical protein [Paenibacillus nasutitermitis]|uniref:Uncharacterized protein n=1 Tax=Paenibacillus nasutitermitis TaxID=1652958 RepID=A0A916YVG3_9BACL|nr:hypothetical protein [Paenibacillus nasutitermitis]GGD63019.1 hypothetical protein GCM10010911_21020 [Paenibacillus nasutitermitis]
MARINRFHIKSSDEEAKLVSVDSFGSVGEQVYELAAQLENCASIRARVLLEASRSLKMIADALMGDDTARSVNKTPKEDTADSLNLYQAQILYSRIPELLQSANREAEGYPSSSLLLPVRLGLQAEGPPAYWQEQLEGLRRAANAMEEQVSLDMEFLRLKSGLTNPVVLLYEQALRWKNSAEAILLTLTGSISGEEEEASYELVRSQYWKALSDYIKVTQGLTDPELFAGDEEAEDSIHNEFVGRTRLDNEDCWKVTSSLAIQEFKHLGEWGETEHELQSFWANAVISKTDREYEATVEKLLADGKITEKAYWYSCPYPCVYQVGETPVRILGEEIPAGYVFVNAYSDSKSGAQFIWESSFSAREERR